MAGDYPCGVLFKIGSLPYFQMVHQAKKLCQRKTLSYFASVIDEQAKKNCVVVRNKTF